MAPSTRTTPGVPEGRYSRRTDQEADRRLRIAAVVCGALFLGLFGWLGVSYLLRETTMNATVPTFESVSDSELQLQLSVSKSEGTAGSCTVRSQGADGSVVGMSDFPVPAAGDRYSAVVTLRTTARGTTAEVLGCTPAK
ncbi:DUF4307 domain-containing protein [Kitasatospora sp. NPDC094015]|uniref:DUF4307 domain-containing protein n=1 Tax=Kitasatospora sp. NPDC094015 TaxID=3155205 RepID=UPI00332C252B